MKTRARRLEELLGIDDPIILGAFGGVSSVGLTAAVSECGGLGSYGFYGYHPDRIVRTIAEIRAETARPFAVNLWLATGDEVTPADIDLAPYSRALAPLFASVDLPEPEPPDAFLPDLQSQLDAVIEASPAVLSLVYGVPSAAILDAAHYRDICVIGAAKTVQEAVALDAAGVDAIVAAAFALGAHGVQVGTAFLRTRQSEAIDAYRQAIGTVGEVGTVLTQAMSGRLARGIANDAVNRIEASGIVAPFPAQNWLTAQFRVKAAGRGRSDLMSLWAGQAAPLSSSTEACEVYEELCAGLRSE